MAPRFPRKTSFGGVVAEPVAAYVPPPTFDDSKVAEAKKELGVPDPKKPTEKPKPLLVYRTILGLTRQNIADLFNAPVTAEVRVRLLREKTAVEQLAAELTTRIQEVEARLVTRSAAWQKRHRNDDRLSRADRERLKREDNAELKRLQSERGEYYQRLQHWGRDDRDYDGFRVEFRDMLFEQKHPDIIYSETELVPGWTTLTEERRVRNASGGYDLVDRPFLVCGAIRTTMNTRYSIENYRKLLSLGGDALTVLEDGMSWQDWDKWENGVILIAIAEGLFRHIDSEVLLRHPVLKKASIAWCSEEEQDHEEETRQILHTGGASLGVGVSIYGKGWSYSKRSGQWTMKGLSRFGSSFDADPSLRGRPGGSFHPNSAGGVERSSDDIESYDSRDRGGWGVD